MSASALVGDFTNCFLLGCWHLQQDFLDRALAIQQQIDDATADPVCGVQLQREMRHRHGDPTLRFDVVVTSLLAYKGWAPSYLPLTGTRHVVTQTPQVVLDLQFFESVASSLDSSLCLSFDVAAHILPITWVQGLMKELETHLISVVSEQFVGRIWPIDPRRPHDPFAAQTPLTRLDHAVWITIGRHGQRTAVMEATTKKSLGYHDLGTMAQHYAQELSTRGIRPCELVAIVMQKGWEQMVAVLASVIQPVQEVIRALSEGVL